MAVLCREFGISPKTGCKNLRPLPAMRGSRADRQEPASLSLRESASLPGGELHPECEARALQLGARKIRERLLRRFSGIPIPTKSTSHAVLDRHGLVERRVRVRRRAQGTSLSLSLGPRPNELWCTDYKGEFLPGNHQYCYPLTVTDHAGIC